MIELTRDSITQWTIDYDFYDNEDNYHCQQHSLTIGVEGIRIGDQIITMEQVGEAMMHAAQEYAAEQAKLGEAA